jgi:limonene-1,2-epoxide hydrolase
MKSNILILAGFALLGIISCKEAAKTDTAAAPDYAAFNKKVEVVRAFVKAHCAEDLAALTNLLADTLKYSSTVYNGNKWQGKTEMLAVLKGYHDNFENISYAEGIVLADSTVGGFYSGSVYPEQDATNIPTNIRSYGTWTAVESKSKQTVGVKYYALIAVNIDGKIVSYSDYFDTSNLIPKSAPAQ